MQCKDVSLTRQIMHRRFLDEYLDNFRINWAPLELQDTGRMSLCLRRRTFKLSCGASLAMLGANQCSPRTETRRWGRC